MIKIFDDVLPKYYADHIEHDALHMLQYFWNPKTVMNVKHNDPNVYDFGQLTCPLLNIESKQGFKDSGYLDFLKPMMLIIEECLNKDQVFIEQYCRIKYNLMWNVEPKYREMYNTPHPDNDNITRDNTYSMIYYVNDSDGDTIFFDEFFDGDLYMKKSTIKQRVTPKKNRLVLFESNRYHCSSNPVDSNVRSVINFVVRANYGK